MPLVKAQCTNCGGSLEVDNAKEAAVCPFCGQAYVVETAIQNFQINNTHIENTYIVDDEYSRLKEAADYLLSTKEYDGAFEKYEKIKTDYPQKDVQDAINLVIAKTHNCDINYFIDVHDNTTKRIDALDSAINDIAQYIDRIPEDKKPKEFDKFYTELLTIQRKEQEEINQNQRNKVNTRHFFDALGIIVFLIGIIWIVISKGHNLVSYCVMFLGLWGGVFIHRYFKWSENDKAEEKKPKKITKWMLLSLGVVLIIAGVFNSIEAIYGVGSLIILVICAVAFLQLIDKTKK